ncbi:hypothetical protein OSB04_012211 [Centaurea solstitialis]|uniref:Myb/SANT-like domain-containing protein n=1 Tax=Centaurea solstitialis TaxID=347529 RepID=A0AA38WEE3_9ASTR|nr:hypothetical protein OSB04_012211 [Centaurea solstitialis]
MGRRLLCTYTKEEYFDMKHSYARNIIERFADRHAWTMDEEDLLITILQDIPIHGGRCDNGSFKSGMYEVVFSKIRENFWCNDANQCENVEALEILDEYLKKHPNKNYMANKPFPTYERLKLVFGKDIATRNMDESATAALENFRVENDDDFEIEHNVPPLQVFPIQLLVPPFQMKEKQQVKREKGPVAEPDIKFSGRVIFFTVQLYK